MHGRLIAWETCDCCEATHGTSAKQKQNQKQKQEGDGLDRAGSSAQPPTTTEAERIRSHGGFRSATNDGLIARGGLHIGSQGEERAARVSRVAKAVSVVGQTLAATKQQSDGQLMQMMQQMMARR